MIGCPVEAYTKDPVTGVVVHSADTCIGCQYCTWNCSYGVPQYNAERGIVGKCDHCHNRLADGDSPACVAACPETALTIEIVNVAEWRADYRGGERTWSPCADDSISTTRVTLPENLLPDTGRVDTQRDRARTSSLAPRLHAGVTQLAVGRIHHAGAAGLRCASVLDWRSPPSCRWCSPDSASGLRPCTSAVRSMPIAHSKVCVPRG